MCLKSIFFICRSFIVLLCLSCSFSGTVNAATDNPDPFEPINRKIFKLNKFFDTVLMRPATLFYKKAVPSFAKKKISNVLDNLNETRNFANNISQLKFGAASVDLLRFGINTTVGLGGAFDLASDMGLEKNNNIYFGQTLAYWGWNKSAYFIMPLRGPSTFRDAFGQLIDLNLRPSEYLDKLAVKDNVFLDETIFSIATPEQWALIHIGLDAIKVRSLVLELENAISSATVTFDEYEWLRNAYMQSYGEYNGNVYEEDLDEFYSEDF